MMPVQHPRWTALSGLTFLLALGCNGPGSDATADDAVAQLQAGTRPWSFPAIEDNIAHDTLLTQITFDLGDGTFVMVASNVEDTFEGLRLYRYRKSMDNSVDLLAVSSPAYDSWTMLPTFFPLDGERPADAMWVLANFGERESWGQKLLLLDHEFTDMGFMDVALPHRLVEDDGLLLKRNNVAPSMRYRERGDTAEWHFACDSVYVYDDQAGGHDLVLHGQRIRYTFHRDTGLQLWIDGVPRSVSKPA